MNDQTVIIFSFPRKILLELDLATRMGVVKEVFEDISEMQILSVVGGTADEVIRLLEKKAVEPSNLVLHAMRELDLAGNDEDFNASIIAAVEGFTTYGHSGGSSSVAIPMLNALLQYKNLTPLTDEPTEWMSVEMGDTPCWQSIRNPEAFTNDDCFKTYYLLSETAGKKLDESMIHQTAERKTD